MPRFRKRPVVIEAEQVLADRPLPDGVYCVRDEGCYIDTLEGRHIVREGDYIITGVKGEKYPCKEDIFHLTYESVDD